MPNETPKETWLEKLKEYDQCIQGARNAGGVLRQALLDSQSLVKKLEIELAQARAQPAPQTALQRERLHDAMQKYAFWFVNNHAATDTANREKTMDKYLHESYVEVASHPASPKVDREKLADMINRLVQLACMYSDREYAPSYVSLKGEILSYVCGLVTPAPKLPEWVTTDEFAKWRGYPVDETVLDLTVAGVRKNYTSGHLRWHVADIRKMWPDFKPEVRP